MYRAVIILVTTPVLLLPFLGVGPTARDPQTAKLPWQPVATFSILGFDPETGEIGGAVQSRVFSVGNGVLWGEADVGVVATQAIVDVSYGPKALKLLREGLSPEAAVKKIWDDDPDPRPGNWSKQGRQFAVMNAKGAVAAFTGPKATTWAGHKVGENCSAQGNILAGAAVVDNMVDAFEKAKAGCRSGSWRRRMPGKRPAATNAACSLPPCSSLKKTAASGSTTTSCCACKWTITPSRSRNCADW